MPDDIKPEPSRTARAVGNYSGTPIAVVVVWYVNTYIVKGEMPIEAAVVVGALVNQVVTTLWHIVSQLLGKAGIET
jgi:hypothetical protein